MALVAILTLIFYLFYLWLKSPFQYPYFYEDIDISGRRNVNTDDLLDEFLNDGGYEAVKRHQSEINRWKEQSHRRIERSGPLKLLRYKQYLNAVNDGNAYRFEFIRFYTRYQQRNYVKTSYQDSQVTDHLYCSFEYLKERELRLAEIDHETTLTKYRSLSQRQLMTPQLRKKIMIRDNYTCQKCGKYMPDKVGLQIDHIIPVSKGGKTVESNLQVLCSRCNGRKSNNSDY